ncbi:formyltetrahydrofolate-dependent phosphoribosylglycinamide formyltransferase [Lachnospiraceae bacterium KHCPX20]|nr:formyltetrahydrofolate-dependent phosphoribosylglycinamide formyltransferase [Lachnospiraceae bacterium KHCPX20]
MKAAVLVSGGGTNLQAIMDAVERGRDHGVKGISALLDENGAKGSVAELAGNAGDVAINDVEISLVISNNPGAYALERAKKAGIEAVCISPKDYENRDAFNQALCNRLVEADVDLVVLAGFLVVIPPQMVEQFPHRIINIHPSLIPSFCGKGYYGLKVHEGVLSRGAKVTGATVHFVDEGTDTGPIILQKAVYVAQDDTAATLQRRVMEEAEWKLLPAAIDLIAHNKVTVEDRIVTIS